MEYENENNDDIYALVTKLCKKFATDKNGYLSTPHVKKLRSKCFGILLGKHQCNLKQSKIIKEYDDPYCQLLSWKFELDYGHGLKEHSEKLGCAIEEFRSKFGDNNTSINNVLTFLFPLRTLPNSVNQPFAGDAIFKSNSMFTFFEERSFHLPRRVPSREYEFTYSLLFPKKKSKTKLKTKATMSSHFDDWFNEKTNLRESPTTRDEGYNSPEHNKDLVLKTADCAEIQVVQDQSSINPFFNKRILPLKLKQPCSSSSSSSCNIYENEEDSIWDLQLKQETNYRRTWETFGHINPPKEKPFLSEAGPKATTYAFHLKLSAYNEESFQKKSVKMDEFLKYCQLLLVGIESKCFKYVEEKKGFILIPQISVEGLSSIALKKICDDLIFCGDCFKGLHNLTQSRTLKKQENGFVFYEFSESIYRYLMFCREIVIKKFNYKQLLGLHEDVSKIKPQLLTLAEICNVGPFYKSESVPHGVALINFLYEKLLTLADKSVIMVLMSILYPCCQVYFNTFLQPWVFDGIKGEEDEFFVYAQPKFLSTLGRTYWTRSFNIKEDLVPDFLTTLHKDVLNCGKTINLLKICNPNSEFCKYISEKRLQFSFCLNQDQLTMVDHQTNTYYYEALQECGPKLSFTKLLIKNKEQEDVYLSLVTEKRAVTLKRIEMEKLKEIEEANKKRREVLDSLREQYEAAVINKMSHVLDGLRREIKLQEANEKLHILKEKLIKNEANNLIEYYDNLQKITEERKKNAERNIKRLKEMLLDDEDKVEENKTEEIEEEKMGEEGEENISNKSGEDSEISIKITNQNIDNSADPEINVNLLPSPNTLDVLNANTEKAVVNNSSEIGLINKDENTNANANTNKNVRELAEENFRIAKMNKQKVLNVEMHVELKEKERIKEAKNCFDSDTEKLTDAQKNKLKVMASEFGIDLTPKKKEEDGDDVNKNLLLTLTEMEINRNRNTQTFHHITDKNNIEEEDVNRNNTNNIITEKTIMEINRNKIMNITEEVSNKYTTAGISHAPTSLEINRNRNTISNECFSAYYPVDNENFLNKNNIANNGNENVNINSKEGEESKHNLNLALSASSNQEGEEDEMIVKRPQSVEPMSIGSTPMSDIISTPFENKLRLNIFDIQVDSLPSCSLVPTAGTGLSNLSEDCFNFDLSNLNSKEQASRLSISHKLSKKISLDDAQNVSLNCLKMLLHDSIEIPLKAQLRLAENELLKYFVHELHYLTHLNSLRNYFFLLDGEFGRNMTEGLFETLYNTKRPNDLINCVTLRNLIYKALNSSSKLQNHSNCLSLKINDVPKIFNLRDPNVLDCLSLAYQVSWPLNIILPSDTIAKYDEVFKFLIKLHRVSWVLKKIFVELKEVSCEVKQIYLMDSAQYQRLHQCRHVMTHFIQTLQCYIVGDVLQTSWEIFEKDLGEVTNIDQLYMLHTTYMKNIIFMCLLNQRSTPIRETIFKIFTLVFKFYDYLRSRQWECEEGVYTHPNFNKLEDLYDNFEQIIVYLFRSCRKAAKNGYQPQLNQFLDMLDINNYYSKKFPKKTTQLT